jgi:uncharacterized membrane protein
MSIRAFPLSASGTTANEQSETVPFDEVARRMGKSTETIRRWIKADLINGKGRVPGSRGEGSSYVVIRAVFERAMREGREPERVRVVVPADLQDAIDALREQGTKCFAEADRLANLMRQQSA